MRFVVFAGLLSLVAAAPVQEEKRQTDALSLTAPAPPAGYPTGAFPPPGSPVSSTVLTNADYTIRKLHGLFRETNWHWLV